MSRDQPTLADRLVSVMRMRERLEEATSKLGERPSADPRFALDMAAMEAMNGVADALTHAWTVLDRLRQVAERIPVAAPEQRPFAHKCPVCMAACACSTPLVACQHPPLICAVGESEVPMRANLDC